MTYTFYASATFPATARQIPAIAAFLDGYGHEVAEAILEGNGLICVSNVRASNGKLDVTELLTENRIEYDHYNRDDHACHVWTVKYRLNADGELVEVVSASEQDEALSNFAKSVFKAMEEGRTEEVYALLNEAIAPDVEDIEVIAKNSAVEITSCKGPQEETPSEPCIKVEYDTTYTGGGYSGVGDSAFIPVALIKSFDDAFPDANEDAVHAAFRKLMHIDSMHIIHYTAETYTTDGELIEQ